MENALYRLDAVGEYIFLEKQNENQIDHWYQNTNYNTEHTLPNMKRNPANQNTEICHGRPVYRASLDVAGLYFMYYYVNESTERWQIGEYWCLEGCVMYVEDTAITADQISPTNIWREWWEGQWHPSHDVTVDCVDPPDSGGMLYGM